MFKLPPNILPLVDGDWILYMACSAVEYPLMKEWKEECKEAEDKGLPLPPEPTPSFEDTVNVLTGKIKEIKRVLKTETIPILFFTGHNNFRKELAVSKTYKGNRPSEKPYFYEDLKGYIEINYPTREEDNLEADDLMAMYQTHELTFKKMDFYPKDTCIVTVDKDLRQVNGWHYSPEGHNYPSFGPKFVTDENSYIELSPNGKKVIGTGWKFFYSQLLTGDTVDNIPGLPLYGPKKAVPLLVDTTTEGEAYELVREAYRDKCLMADDYLLEQARLLWMVRGYDDDGEPEMWFPPMVGESNETS